jgi:uncharacterized protein YxjI
LFTFLKYKFIVDVPGPYDYTVEGDFFAHEYSFTRAGRVVAKVSKEWLTLADTYGVWIQDNEDQILILACTVVIDMISSSNRDR